MPHRLSYEKDLYKKVRIHCVIGRTLPEGKAMKKIFIYERSNVFLLWLLV